MKKGYVYILASKKNGTIYIGVTSDMAKRLDEHEKEVRKGFTSKYKVKTLVWFETFDLITDAIQREKTMKKYPRQWKINLIEKYNPDWRALHPLTGEIIPEDFFGHGLPGQARQ